jgi:hypothetical protein
MSLQGPFVGSREASIVVDLPENSISTLYANEEGWPLNRQTRDIRQRGIPTPLMTSQIRIPQVPTNPIDIRPMPPMGYGAGERLQCGGVHVSPLHQRPILHGPPPPSAQIQRPMFPSNHIPIYNERTPSMNRFEARHTMPGVVTTSGMGIAHPAVCIESDRSMGLKLGGGDVVVSDPTAMGMKLPIILPSTSRAITQSVGSDIGCRTDYSKQMLREKIKKGKQKSTKRDSREHTLNEDVVFEQHAREWGMESVSDKSDRMSDNDIKNNPLLNELCNVVEDIQAKDNVTWVAKLNDNI